MSEKPLARLALVLSGGGARGAYEAGVVHYIRTQLPKEVRERSFDILCGSSVGAINTCFFAATAHDPIYQGTQGDALWRNLRQENVYKRDMASLAKFLGSSTWGIAKNIFSRRLADQARSSQRHHFRGLLNTAPLLPFLKKQIPWGQIRLNVRNKAVSAVSVTTTNVASGRLELFIEKHPDIAYTGHYVHHFTELEPLHAVASGAIPIVFPSQRIGRNYYMDGGLRANTPMSPGIQLGAEKILVIGLQHESEHAEPIDLIDPFSQKDPPPSLGNLVGKILSSIFLDKLDYDIQQLTRINRIVDWGEGCFGPDFLQRVNNYLSENGIVGDIANRGLKRLSVMKVMPSRDLREVFLDSADSVKFFKEGLSSFERILLKILDVDVQTGKDFLSFIMFVPEYIRRLLELGFEDARLQHNELCEFLAG